MKDLLEFIDSADIREYNRETGFVPAEWAVLIRASKKQTMEEKMEALQYLVDHYKEADFGDEKVNIFGRGYPLFDKKIPIREVVKKTLALWQDILDDRGRNENVVFAAKLTEKGYSSDSLAEYVFFADYQDAFAYLSHEKQKYLDDEELKEIETAGEIHRIKMGGGYDAYYFDTQMRLVDLGEDADRVIDEKGMLLSPLEKEVYKVFVPLPFRTGNIVKVDNWNEEPYYGVISHEWKLPEDKQVLKLLRAVRQGKLDFYTLLHKYSRKELDQILKWNL